MRSRYLLYVVSVILLSNVKGPHTNFKLQYVGCLSELGVVMLAYHLDKYFVKI